MTPSPDSTPWRTLAGAAARTHRGKRFLSREVKAGRLRAARIGGRGELLFRDEWLDQWIEDQATPLVVPVRRRA
jgi:hypothetical protein